MKKPIFLNSIDRDYSDYCLTKLQEIDPAYSESDTIKRVQDYHRYKFRKIVPVPRQVHTAESFTCPADLQSAYEQIISTIQEGGSLLPYQSRRLKSTDYDDAMLMDWDVQHLHLGSVLEPDGFVKRNDLLFIRFTRDSAYIIGIFKHGEWTNLDVIEILHANWPSSIKPFNLNGILDTSFSPTADELKNLRKVHANSSIKVSDGTIYMGPGMGVTCAGTPTKVQFDLMKLHRIFASAFEQIEANWESIFEQLGIVEDHDKITVGLFLQDNKLVYVLKEVQKGIILNQTEPAE